MNWRTYLHCCKQNIQCHFQSLKKRINIYLYGEINPKGLPTCIWSKIVMVWKVFIFIMFLSLLFYLKLKIKALIKVLEYGVYQGWQITNLYNYAHFVLNFISSMWYQQLQILFHQKRQIQLSLLIISRCPAGDTLYLVSVPTATIDIVTVYYILVSHSLRSAWSLYLNYIVTTN